MSVLALPIPASGALRRFADGVRHVLRAVADGAAAAHRYERLSRMSDARLAQLGITREDVPWFALYGRPRPR